MFNKKKWDTEESISKKKTKKLLSYKKHKKKKKAEIAKNAIK